MALVADISAVLALFTPVIDFILAAVGDVIDVILAQPLLLIPIAVVMLFTIIATFRRFV